jgi:competence protein ComEC
MGVGATGMALAPAEILAEPQEKNWRVALNSVRQSLSDRIRAALPDANGGIATAIVTGETSGIPPDVLAAYRNSGLAHILVIAGLHMGLLSGLVFFVVRGGLALFPFIALNYPIKKWAALISLAVTGGYMALAGFPVPATRAFIMAAVVLLAILLDRSSLSLRLWAFAASVILLVEPEQIVGPSFQMSFSAVAALIVTYESLGPWLGERHRDYRGWMGRVGLHLFRLGLTSFVAGTATMVYGLYHFNRIAIWQVLANLLAVPLVGIFIMPFALSALFLMPFGLEYWPLQVMGQGIEWVTEIGFWSANLPYAQINMPPMPVWGLIVFSLGGLWLCLWRTSWRFLGLLPMGVGLLSLAFLDKPDILLDEHGSIMAVRTGEDSLLINHGGRIVKETWGARAGPLAISFWPKHGRSSDGRLSCDDDWCLYRPTNHEVALIKTEQALASACTGFDVVISAVPVRDPCPGAKLLIDRFDLWRRGAHEIWLRPDGSYQVETVAHWQGDRPWSFHPQPRHFVKAPE